MTKLKKINFKDKKLWVVFIIIVVIAYTNQPIDDKKLSTSEWGRVGLGVGALAAAGAIAFISYGTLWMYYVPLLILGASLLGIGGLSLFSGISGLLTPDKTIPSWVWIAGFAILAMMALRKNK